MKTNQLPTVKLPKSIIEYYLKYRNTKSNIKPQIFMGTYFEIDDNYEIIDTIGGSCYRIVVAAQDKKNSNNPIAIKKIERAFEHKIYTKLILSELKIRRLLRHDNVIDIQKILLPKSREQFQDIYIISELMETDLASIIKSPQVLTEEHCQFFLYQLLHGIKYIHSAQILHRNLVIFFQIDKQIKKPRNLLVNSDCDLKICDFSLSRGCLKDIKIQFGALTDSIVIRWYSAPELLLNQKQYQYSTSIDVWSVGCIFAELLLRKPFLPGADSYNYTYFHNPSVINQIELIFNLIGSPTEEEINTILREKSQKFVRTLKKREPQNLEKIFPKASPIGFQLILFINILFKALDLLKKFFIFSPEKRITIDQALNHPYLAALHCLEDEPTTVSVDKLEFEFEEYSLTLEQLKDLIYEETLLYHFPDFKNQQEEKKKQNVSLIQHILDNDNNQQVII